MIFVLEAIVNAGVIVALGLAAAMVVRRASASSRHAVLAAAIGGALLVPVLKMLLPALPVLHWPASGTAVSSGIAFDPGGSTFSSSIADAASSGPGAIPWAALLAIVWLAGAVGAAGVLATSLIRLARFTKRCRPVDGRRRELTDALSRACGIGRHVRLLESEDPAVLVTCGVFRPTIILPAGTSRWTEARMRIVLTHELAHIRRNDAALQLAGEALRVLHWINPLVWMACRRLRQESEFACDDEVLRRGIVATDYATELLGIARQMSGQHVAWAGSHAIGHPSTLERRVTAMLHQRNRTPVGRRGWILASLAALGVSLPLAAASVAPGDQPSVVPADAGAGARAAAAPLTHAAIPDAPQAAQPATISGRILDQSGAALPAVALTLTNQRTGAALTMATDAAGRFTFRDLQAAKYDLSAELPGFATVHNTLTAGPGAAIDRTITMPLGTVTETIAVSCGSHAAPIAAIRRLAGESLDTLMFDVAYAQEQPPAAPRVGGSLRAPMKIKDVHPVCPADAPAAEATVQLTGRIDVDGMINDLKPVAADGSTPPAAALTESALDAVGQWKFTPTMLNGHPEAVNLHVTVTFTRR